MKNRKLLLAGLGGILCLSFAGFAYAQGEPVSDYGKDVPQVEWQDATEYEKNAPQIEWWTTEEYEKWILQQKEELESLIGSGDGWYDGQNVYHEWTRENVDVMIAEYYRNLESMKNGVLYSKEDEDGDGYSMIPPSDDVEFSYEIHIVKKN